MRRILIIIAVGALSLCLVAIAAFYGLFYSAPGRSVVASIVEGEVQGEVGGEVKIGALEGALPNHVVLRDVVFTKEGAIWLRVRRIELDWKALALLGDRIDIDRVAVIGAHFLGTPPEKPADPDAAPRPFGLPSGLPDLTIRDLRVDELEVDPAVAGRALRMDGAGSVAMRGRAFEIRLDATSSGDSDTASILISIDPRAGRGAVDVLVSSQPGGVIASLAGPGGGLFLEARGDAPLADFAMEVDAIIGGYGSVDAMVTGDVSAAETLHVDAALTLGEKLGDIRDELGDAIALKATLRKPESGALRIGIDQFRSAAGLIAGELTLSQRKDVPQSLSGALKADFAETYRPDIQALIGNEAALTFGIAARQSGYSLDAVVTAPFATLALDNATSDLDTRLSGVATLEIIAKSGFPAPLDAGATAQAIVTLAAGSPAHFEELSIVTPDGSTFDGEADWDGAREAIALGGDASFSPALIKRLVPDLTPDGPVVARLSASGPIGRIAGAVDADLPRLAFGKAALPPSSATVRFARSDASLAADIAARSKDRQAELKTMLALAEDGTISVSDFALTAPAFTLMGAGAYHRNDDSISLDAAYAGAKGAEPWPGLPLEGDISVKGSFSPNGASKMALSATGLASRDIAFGKLEAHASGPSASLLIEASAQDAFLPVLGAVGTLDAAARANVSETTRLVVTRFEGGTFRLTAPATLTFDDGVAVSGLRAATGATGTLAADGDFSSTRWRATVSATDAAIAGADAYVTGFFDLDTDRKAMARGELRARSAITDTQASAIDARLAWDGRRLALNNLEADDAFKFNVSLPLFLDRSPRLSARFEGDLRGTLNYEGPIGPFAAYLPPSLQAVEGQAALEARLAGTVEKPEITGSLALEDGAYTEIGSGASIEHIEGKATARAGRGETTISYDFAARGLGQTAQTVHLTGTASLADAATIDGVLKLDAARFSGGPVSSTIASGDVDIEGPLKAVGARGDITLATLNADIAPPSPGRLVDINVVEVGGATGPTTPMEPAGPPLTLALNVKANDKVFIRGRGLESEWSADIAVSGDAEDPLFEGKLELRRGYLDFAGRRFALSRGLIAFDRYAPNNPRLDIRAEHETNDGVTAIIEIKGRAQSPDISLLSTPSLPSEDVMALVLFGKPATDLSALESLQVAQALAQITGVGPFGGAGITGTARRALGLDMLSLAFDAETGAGALEVGKYVADGLFVSATQDARGENGSVRIEYEIAKSVTVETELKQDGDQTVSANWKIDF